MWGTPAHAGVDVAPLRALQRAGNAVYDTVDAAEKLRQSLQQSGADPWSYAPAQSAALLCTWAASVLQTIGESLLAGATTAAPGEPARLPAPSYDQAWAMFAPVEQWVTCAKRALVDPSYTLAGVPLPASLPPWTDAPAPPGYLRSLLDAVDAVAGRSEVAGAAVLTTQAEAAHPADVAKLRGLMAQASASVDYARNLVDPSTSGSFQTEVQNRLHVALQLWFHIGQLFAMPALLATYAAAPPTTAPAAVPQPAAPIQMAPPAAQHPFLNAAVSIAGSIAAAQEAATVRAVQQRGAWRPGLVPLAMMLNDTPLDPVPTFVSAGFDPWCITEPTAAAAKQQQPDAVAQLHQLWQSDPAPAQTTSVVQQIKVAVGNGDLQIATDANGQPMSVTTCPWPAVYDVLQPVVLGGKLLRPGSKVTVQLGLAPDGFFHRDVVVAAE